jgi:hypothetical protein|nr:type IV toxin-antitoxin system AbiEi family antitoxin domain-containing protein [Spiribacter roseus]
MPAALADEAPGRSVILGLTGPVVQTRETFHDVDMIVEGLVNLSRRRLQPLLAQARIVKVKRLFLYFADRHRHQWAAHLNPDRITLGKGKRALAKGGRLDRKYNITIPEDMDAIW